MKKSLILCSVLLLPALLVAPALAGDTGTSKQVELTGWITDSSCGAKNANKDGAGCVKSCAKNGADVMVYSDGKMYKVSDKELALKHVGYKVVVTGTLTDDGITVSSIRKAEDA